MKKVGSQYGFTLPELLVSGSILVALLVLGAVLIRPSYDQAGLRDAQRKVDLAVLAQSISQYKTTQGELPPTISEKEKFIGGGEDESNLCADLVPEYLDSMPFDLIGGAVDPESGCLNSDYVTGYSVKLENGDRVILSALYTESEDEIRVSISNK